MISPSKTLDASNQLLVKRDLAEYGAARFRDQIFDAVLALWRRRSSEGWTQKQLADQIGRDAGWVSKNLKAPGNWTLSTAGEFIQALQGEAEVTVAALEDSLESVGNYNAYEGYLRIPHLDVGSVIIRVPVTSIGPQPNPVNQLEWIP